MYRLLVNFLQNFFRPDQIFKFGFNVSPMYRRSTGRVTKMSRDMMEAKVEIKLNYRNRNYVGALFGGSMLSATDPIYMIQLMQILGDNYVVWDKAASIRYKRPARENVVAYFKFAPSEIEDIKQQVEEQNEIDVIKHLNIEGVKGTVFAELDKTIYVAKKEHYKAKLAARKTTNKA